MFSIAARRSACAAARLARGYAAAAPLPEAADAHVESASSTSHDQSASSTEAGPSKPRAHAARISTAEQTVENPGSRKGRKARTPAQRAAYINARAFALAMATQQGRPAAAPSGEAVGTSLTDDTSAPAPGKRIRRRSTAINIESSAEEPQLLDLLSKKPDRTPNPLNRRYPQKYLRLVTSIEQAFVKAQLVAFSRALGLPANSTKSNAKIIARIAASWGWPSPEEHAVERQMRDRTGREAKREVISHDITGMTATDVHLFLSDPALVDQMLRRNTLKISILRDTDVATSAAAHERLALPGQPQPAPATATQDAAEKSAGEERVIIRVNGPNTAIKHLEEFLAIRRDNKHHVDVPLTDLLGHMPAPVLTTAISRATMTFIKPIGDRVVRISGIRQDNMKRAEGLLLRAAVRRLPSSQPDQSLIVTPSSTHPLSSSSEPSSTSPSLSPHPLGDVGTTADSLLSPSALPSPSSASPISATPQSSTPEQNYTLLPFTPPSNFPLPWHAAAEMQSAQAHPVRLSHARVWKGYNSGRMTGHDKEELGRASVRVLKDKGGGSGVDVGSGSGGGDGSGAGDARRLLEVMKVDNVAADEEVVNTLSFGHAIYSSHLGPLDTLLTSTPLDELREYIQDMSMPVFAPSSTPRMIHNFLDGASTTVRHLRYRAVPSAYPSALASDAPLQKQGEEGELVYDFTYTLPQPPNLELDAARMDAELGNMADPANGWPIRDAVPPIEPSDWVSELEAQIDADKRRQEAEAEAAAGGKAKAETEVRTEADQEELLKEVGAEAEALGAVEGSVIDGATPIAEDSGQVSGATRGVTMGADAEEPTAGIDSVVFATEVDHASSIEAVPEQSDSRKTEEGDVASLVAEPAKFEPAPLPSLEITSSLSRPRYVLLHIPNRANDILHIISTPVISAAAGAATAVPDPIKRFFTFIHEASHRDVAASASASAFNPSSDSYSYDDTDPSNSHELDSALSPSDEADARAYATYDPPPRFTTKVNGQLVTFALESDEERTTVSFESGGVETRWVQRREMGVPWAKAVACTELEYKGTEPPKALWSQLNQISMDAPPNAVKASRGEMYDF